MVPKALGGGLEGDPLLLVDTCVGCNTACGRHVDGPFIRSWFTSNARSVHALTYCDLARNPVLPLTYMGVLRDIEWDGHLCEMWLGLTGDVIYQLHKPYPRATENRGWVGKPVNARRDEIDPGFVFLFIHATNPEWHRPIVLSVMEQFDDSVLYFGNSNVPRGGHPRLKEIPPNLKPLHDLLRSRNGKGHDVQFELDPYAGERFVPKLALGFGARFLAPEFLDGPDAKLLRDCLWERDHEKRAELKLHGSGFLSEGAEEFGKLLGWPAGHVFVFQPVGEALAFTCVFYGQQVSTVAVSTNPQDWAGRVGDEGSVFLVAPGIRRGFGLVPLPTYVAARYSQRMPQTAPIKSFISDGERRYPQPPRHPLPPPTR